MKAPVVALEVRWRTEDETSWQTLRLPPRTAFDIPNAVRGETYTVELRNVGSNGMLSAPTILEVTIPTTNREGAAALPPVAVGNVGSRWVSGTSVTYAASDTSATISVTAGTLQIGDKQISYGASSAVISGTAEEERLVYLYYDDPRLEGGTRTLGVTTDRVASMANFGRVFIANLLVVFDVSGGGGSGGGGDIGGGGGGSGEFPTNPV